MTRVVLTGATSFLGVSLARSLIASGNTVAVVARSTSPVDRLAGLGVELHRVNGGAPELSAVLMTVQPDCVVHLAGRYVRSHVPTDVAELVDGNVRYGSEVLEAMAMSGVRRVVTAASYFQHADGPDYRPLNLYAATKQAFESVLAYYVDAGAVDAVTLVLTDVYGPGDWRKKLVNVAVDAAGSGKPLPLSAPDTIIDLVHIDDVVRGIAAAMAPSFTGTTLESRHLLSSGHPTTVALALEVIERAVGRPIDKRWGAFPLLTRTMTGIWPGPTLPGWAPEVDLERGIASVLEASR